MIVLSLAPFHAAISFTGAGSVYVYDTPVRDILLAGGTPVNLGPRPLFFFTVFMDNWGMQLLFLVAGIGAALSLRKRNCGDLPALEQWPILLDQVDPRHGCVMEFRRGVYVPGAVRTAGQGLLQHTAPRSQNAVTLLKYSLAQAGERLASPGGSVSPRMTKR